jgi:hypothetical protein
VPIFIGGGAPFRNTPSTPKSAVRAMQAIADRASHNRYHFRHHVPYMLALFAGLLLIICIPEISLTLPRLAGLIK